MELWTSTWKAFIPTSSCWRWWSRAYYQLSSVLCSLRLNAMQYFNGHFLREPGLASPPLFSSFICFRKELFERPSLVAEWLTHSAAMCSRAWRAQWPEFDSAGARPPAKELFLIIPTLHLPFRSPNAQCQSTVGPFQLPAHSLELSSRFHLGPDHLHWWSGPRWNPGESSRLWGRQLKRPDGALTLCVGWPHWPEGTVSDVCLKRTSLLDTSSFSALEVLDDNCAL